jgi:hypothetical protein
MALGHLGALGVVVLKLVVLATKPELGIALILLQLMEVLTVLVSTSHHKLAMLQYVQVMRRNEQDII